MFNRKRRMPSCVYALMLTVFEYDLYGIARGKSCWKSDFASKWLHTFPTNLFISFSEYLFPEGYLRASPLLFSELYEYVYWSAKSEIIVVVSMTFQIPAEITEDRRNYFRIPRPLKYDKDHPRFHYNSRVTSAEKEMKNKTALFMRSFRGNDSIFSLIKEERICGKMQDFQLFQKS